MCVCGSLYSLSIPSRSSEAHIVTIAYTTLPVVTTLQQLIPVQRKYLLNRLQFLLCGHVRVSFFVYAKTRFLWQKLW